MRNNWRKILVFGILAFSFVLRLYGIGNNCYTGDEARIITLCSGRFTDLFWQDVHPPLYRILLSQWINLFGTSETATRVFPALCGTLSVLFIFLLGKGLGGTKSGLVALWLGAISPFLILFSRISRCFSLFLLLNLGSIWLFLMTYRYRKMVWWYVGITILNIYAGTFGVITLICQWIWIIIHKQVRDWLIPQLLIVAASSFCLVKLFSLISPIILPFSRVPSIYGIPGKLGYCIFAFSLGQTVFPWNLKVVIPGMLACLAGAIGGLTFLAKKRKKEELLFLLLFGLLPLLPIVTNCDLPQYYLGGAALYYVLIAIGISRMRNSVAFAVLILITAFNSYSLCNLYTNREYNMQSFTDAWRDVSLSVEKISDEETKVVAYHRAFIWYYNPDNLVRFDLRNPSKARKEVARAKRIIFVQTLGSGVFSSCDEPIYEFKQWLDENFTLVQSIGFSENEAFKTKRKLLKRSFPRFRIEVLVYENRNS